MPTLIGFPLRATIPVAKIIEYSVDTSESSVDISESSVDTSECSDDANECWIESDEPDLSENTIKCQEESTVIDSYYASLNNWGTSYNDRNNATKQAALLAVIDINAANKGVIGIRTGCTYLMPEDSFIDMYKDMREDLKALQSQVHFQLATDYEIQSTQHEAKGKCFNTCDPVDEGPYYVENSKEFDGAMCLFHLKVASVLGDSDATTKLAQLEKDNVFHVPKWREADFVALRPKAHIS